MLVESGLPMIKVALMEDTNILRPPARLVETGATENEMRFSTAASPRPKY